jgi:hypothetical protein
MNFQYTILSGIRTKREEKCIPRNARDELATRLSIDRHTELSQHLGYAAAG